MKALTNLSLLLNALGLLSLIAVIWYMGGIRTVISKITNRGFTEQYDMLVDQYSKIKLDSVNVLMLGNSITAAGSWQEWLTEDSVINRGIPGDGIEGLQRRMADYSCEVNTVFVMIGINDLAYHPKEWLIKRYPAFLQELKNVFSDAKIVVQSILPVNNDVSSTGRSNQDIDVVNEAMSIAVNNIGFEYLDLGPLFKDEAGALKANWTSDGLHINGAAYSEWSLLLQNYLNSNKK